MHKEPSWRAKAMYIVFAFALVFGLAGVVAMPAAVVASGSVSLTAVPDHCLTPLDSDITATVTGGTTPYTYTFTWNFEYMQNVGDGYKSGNHSDYDRLFGGVLQTTAIVSSASSTTVSHRFDIPGWYKVQVKVVDGNTVTYIDTTEIQTLGIVPSPIAYDAKGGTQKFCVKGLNGTETIDWYLVSGVELIPADIEVVSPDPDTGVKVKGTGDVNVTCVELRTYARGDIRIKVDIGGHACGNQTLVTEKKWGDVHHTLLDLDASTEVLDGPVEERTIPPEATGNLEETLKDTVYGEFLSIEGTRTIGHAILHWWIFEDTVANQEKINDLMDHLVAHGGALDDPYGVGAGEYWAAHGKYDSETLPDLIGSLVNDLQPFDIIDYWADSLHADTTIFSWDGYMYGKPWYIQNETEDSWPADDRGTARATLVIDQDELEVCVEEKVMIVTLATYPGGTTPKQDPHNGENIVSLEKAKKHFHKTSRPEVTEVKTPQVRWAGEKIVLEKDWEITDAHDYVAVYHLDQQSIGTLYQAGDNPTVEKDGGDVWVQLSRTDDTSAVILETQFQGKADVEAALYYGTIADGIDAGTDPLVNIGFPVFFLAFEDIALDTDLSSTLTNLVPDEDAADVVVQVKGWFTSDELGPALDPDTGSIRAARAVDVDKDGTLDRILPEGRYILPDDWARLAGNNYALRPNWDLMDRAHEDAIVSPVDLDWPAGLHEEELGPYNVVKTTAPPGEADNPCIGPFNTLQRWTQQDMWFADDIVPADFKVAAPLTLPRTAADVRNTVVPDGAIDWYDCPMPQALVIFDILPGYPTGASLSGLDKGNLVGYGVDDVTGKYQSPFYAVEVPSSEFITSAGYNWASWDTDGPYDYWGDLVIDSILSNTTESPVVVTDVEGYCDNHGIAGVTVDALSVQDTVTITATVDFPNSLKKGQYPAMTSDEIDLTWGPGEFDPDFVGTPRVCEEVEGCDVTFTNYTTGGVEAYSNAIWNFGDGTDPVEGEAIDNGDTIVHTYAKEGTFNVKLDMWDAESTHADQIEYGYITVGAGGVPTTLWDFDAAGYFPQHMPDACSGTVVLDDLTVPDCVQGVWWFNPSTLEWDFWIRDAVCDLEVLTCPSEDYMVLVNSACDWEIPLP